ncbi:MAG: RNA polymerase sigma factor [Pirellulales bacterium]
MTLSSPDTRASLILRLQDAGDVAAWQEFVELYGRVLFRVARGRGFQAADADNLVQEVLFTVARSVASWLEREDRGSFRAWLLRIARNEAADMMSRRGTRPLGHDGEAADQVLQALPSPDTVSSQLDLEYERTVFRWAADKVRAAVASQTWEAFRLTHIQGLSIDEAARILQTRPANIYFGRSRVMARIRELVALYEDQA